VAALCAPWLAGCESWNKPSEWWNKPPDPPQTGAPPSDAEARAADTTGSIAIPGDTVELRGDLNSDLNLGKRHFRQGDFGLAEVHFRRAVEKGLPDARDAAEALKIVGPAPEILNNQGYSYLMRGDYARARVKLNAAYAKDPANPHILANLDLLDRSVRPR
jgi:Flp pilus assembly protein TadD